MSSPCAAAAAAGPLPLPQALHLAVSQDSDPDPDTGWPPDNGLTGVHTDYHGAPCPYPPSVLDFLSLRGVDPEVVEATWPCELRIFWVHDMHLFVLFVRFLYAYVTMFVVGIGMLLNCFALRVLSSRAMRGTSLTVYLKALSVSDMGALFFTYCLGYWRSHHPAFNKLLLNNDSLCRMHKVLVSMFPMTSQGLQTALTIERLLVVWRPMRAPNPAFPQESARCARRVVAGVYALFSAVSLTKWYFSGFEQYSSFEYARCDLNTHSAVEAVYVYVAFSTYLPGMLIFVSNVLLVLRLRRSDALRRSLFAGSVPHGATYQTDSAAYTLMLFSLLYLVLQLPLGIVETIELYWDVSLYRVPPKGDDAGPEVKAAHQEYISWLIMKLRLKWIRALLFWLFQLSFVLNFVVYLKSASRFRAVAKELMWRWMGVPRRAARGLKTLRWRNRSSGAGTDTRSSSGTATLPLTLMEMGITSSSSSSSDGRCGPKHCSATRSTGSPTSCWRLPRPSHPRAWSCASRIVRCRRRPSSGAASRPNNHTSRQVRRCRARFHTWGCSLRGSVAMEPLQESSASSSCFSPCSASANGTFSDNVFEESFSPPPNQDEVLPIGLVSGYGALNTSQQNLLCEMSPHSNGSVLRHLQKFRSDHYVDRIGVEDVSERKRRTVSFQRFLSHQHKLV